MVHVKNVQFDGDVPDREDAFFYYIQSITAKAGDQTTLDFKDFLKSFVEDWEKMEKGLIQEMHERMEDDGREV